MASLLDPYWSDLHPTSRRIEFISQRPRANRLIRIYLMKTIKNDNNLKTVITYSFVIFKDYNH